jgi:hypothetical protein
MATRTNAIAWGIVLTVIPSTCLFTFTLVFSLFGGAAIVRYLLINLAVMVLIGVVVGWGTRSIYPNKWLLVIGSQAGWLGGSMGANLIAEMIPISLSEPLAPYESIALIILCGSLIGLFPATFVRIWNWPDR